MYEHKGFFVVFSYYFINSFRICFISDTGNFIFPLFISVSFARGLPIVLLFFKVQPLVSLVLSLVFLLCILFFPAQIFSVSPSACIRFTLLSFLQFLEVELRHLT